MHTLTHNGTAGRTYGGDPDLVHIHDGDRKAVGRMLAGFLEMQMRYQSPKGPDLNAPLCPGCYMVALVDAAIDLAAGSGQSLRELGHTMSQAFADLAEQGHDYDTAQIEEIAVRE